MLHCVISTAGYSEDTDFSQTSASDRRKKYLDKSGRHSLDESSQDKTSTPRIKPASSESRLSGSDKPGLNVPEGKRSSSRLSLLGDKLMDTAKSIGDKKTKTGRSPFPSIFKKNKGADIPQQDGKRTRSVEYGSIDRRVDHGSKSHREQHRQSNKAATLPMSRTANSMDSETGGSTQAPVINIEAPRGMIPYEFQDAIGRRRHSEGSDAEISDAELSELQAMADMIDEYHYAVRVLPGQDPAQVFVGWVTPGFHFSESSFDMKKTRHVVLTTLESDYNLKQRYDGI